MDVPLLCQIARGERERERKSSGQAILPCLNTPSRTISLFRWRCSIYSSLNWWFKKKGGIYHFPKLRWLIFNFHHQVRKTVAFSSCQKSTEWNPRIFFKRPINLALDLDRIIFWSSHLGPRTICPHVLKSTLFTTSLCPSCATQRVTKKKMLSQVIS